MDGDGFDDLIVGAHMAHATNSGMARVFSGMDGSVLHSFCGELDYDQLGGSVAGAGDVNMDGFADVIASAVLHSQNGSHSGRVYVFSGADGAVLHTFDGDLPFELLGSSGFHWNRRPFRDVT